MDKLGQKQGNFFYSFTLGLVHPNFVHKVRERIKKESH